MGGDDVTLYELSALISEPGSPRQPVHPDNPYQDVPPLLTVFIALQDILPGMGPTSFLPRSHTAATHAAYNDSVPARDELLQQSSSVAALLRSGDVALFDSRTMHCGGANDAVEGDTRVLLYLSFRNPRATEAIGNVGSMLPSIPSTTLRELRAKLSRGTTGTDPFDDAQEAESILRSLRLAAAQGDARSQLQLGTHYYLGEGGVGDVNPIEAVRWFERAADQGLAHAQFNLGFCYSVGMGVTEVDVERATELFLKAAEQGHPGAREAYDEARG
uniref:Uncharacterized protein n=1 Tax=Proboscia inermis TaxID=420281 RepID=A0A7S0GNJ1_9STRA